MVDYYPPISSRDTDELIAIANSTVDDWQQDAIDQANDELKKRNITREYQKIILDKWKEEFEKSELAYQKQLEENKTYLYSNQKMTVNNN